MEESLKTRIILILGIVSIIFLVGIVGSCTNVRRLKSAHTREMSMRLDLEEKVSKLTQEKKVMEIKLDNLTQAQQETKDALATEQAASRSLKEELDKVTKLKETLEEDLKEALVSSKSKTRK